MADEIDKIVSTSVSVNPPSGPIKTDHFLYLFKLFFNASWIEGEFLAN